jgi:mutator family transposase
VCDGLKGLHDAIANSWPLAVTQTCVLHLIRHTFRLGGGQHWDRIVRDLRPAYAAVPGERNERSAVEAERAGAMAEISDAIVAGILASPELSDPEWDTYSLVAEVSDDVVRVAAYRYSASGPPVSTEPPEDDDDLFWDLRDATRGVDGQAWDVVLVKIRRDTAQLVMNFVAGDGAEIWRVRPDNMASLPESLRPRPEDFQAD